MICTWTDLSFLLLNSYELTIIQDREQKTKKSQDLTARNYPNLVISTII